MGMAIQRLAEQNEILSFFETELIRFCFSRNVQPREIWLNESYIGNEMNESGGFVEAIILSLIFVSFGFITFLGGGVGFKMKTFDQKSFFAFIANARLAMDKLLMAGRRVFLMFYR